MVKTDTWTRWRLTLFCSNFYYTRCWIHLHEQSTIVLHSVAGVIPIVGGRSQRYFELTTRVSPPSTLRRVHLGSRSSSLEARHPPFIVVQTVGNLESTRRQSFVVLLAVARRNQSMRHFCSETGRYIHLQLNWLYSCVATVDCDCFFDFLFLSLP